MSNQNHETIAKRAIEEAEKIIAERYNEFKEHRHPVGDEEREVLGKALKVIATEVQEVPPHKRNIDYILRNTKGEEFSAAFDSERGDWISCPASDESQKKSGNKKEKVAQGNAMNQVRRKGTSR